MVVELADLARLLHQPALITIQSVMKCERWQSRITRSRTPLGYLSPAPMELIPVDALGDVRDAKLILHVERRDAMAVVTRDAVDAGLRTHVAVAARMEHENVGRRERALRHRLERVADAYVFPYARVHLGRAPRRKIASSFSIVLVGIGRPARARSTFPSRAPFCVRCESQAFGRSRRSRHADSSSRSRSLRAPNDPRTRSSSRSPTRCRRSCTSRRPRRSGRYQFHVDPDTNTWIPRNDGRLIRSFGDPHTRIVERDADHWRRDLATPARPGAVRRRGIERIVIAVAAREVPHRVAGCLGQPLPRRRRRPRSNKATLLFRCPPL